ncbi:ATP-binding protein [Pedobacter sandarakinus]|uniref:ATP-binding protein n=1 Tax=Pedobacter sandarakinus TaxID=353156 RepID=UPI002247C159|nr:ATP-binding protein [Pedobacter sandarakinus]MCX2573845.1 ATP-binding protein [Pedobacter sandarakinus]
MNIPVRKIAIVGPESTGKSTLSKQLAKHYKVAWVPEYARYYCENLAAPYTLQDEINMYYGQLALEDAVLATNEKGFIICDTTFVTVKIWSDEMLGETPQLVLDALPERPYDLYLLMDIDLPWQDDPLRDFPNQREYFMEVWHKELTSLKAKYKVISGLGEDRIQNAISVINHFLESSDGGS